MALFPSPPDSFKSGSFGEKNARSVCETLRTLYGLLASLDSNGYRAKQDDVDRGRGNEDPHCSLERHKRRKEH